jgi:acyl-CoA synthetase (AMP-forming)/AMP-acid ligase II
MHEDVISPLRSSGSCALVDPDAGWRLSGDHLLDAVEALAAQLILGGLRPGARAALVLDHSPTAVIAFLAMQRCNATALPVNPQLHATEIARLLETTQPTMLLCEPESSAGLRPTATGVEAPAFELSRGSRPQLDGLGRGRVDRLPDPDPEAIGLLLHTSGTTGRAKAVPLRQRNLTASARAIVASYRLEPSDASYCLMPLFHVHGLVASTLAPLLSGGAVIVPNRVRPRAVWDHAAAYQTTWFSAVPTILQKLLAVPTSAPTQVRFARSCSSSLSPTLWSDLEAHIGVPVVEAYGMTEASHQMTTNPLPPGDRRAGTVGTSAGAEVRILDSDWNPLPPNTAGEVAVRGPGVVDGYLDNDQANEASFRDRWFRTGDLGHLSADGYLTLEGRLKELINRGGEKIAPREIDEVLLTHAAVREAIAFGRPDDKWGEIVEAAVVLDSPISPDALRDHCRAHLAAFKVPHTIHIVDRIPTGATGKVQRRAVADTLSR